MNQRHKFSLHIEEFFLLPGVIIVFLISLLVATKQISAHQADEVMAASSGVSDPDYYLIDCPQDNSQERRLVAPLPSSRYFYSVSYGWFDVSHFNAGNPGKVIDDVEAAVLENGGVITISQGVRDGITGYTANYRVAGDVAAEDVVGVALGIYMDWSTRFEGWQGETPRSLVGPFTPFSVEDLPTQYLGFIDASTSLKLADLFACYLGDVAVSEGPPHLQVIDEHLDELLVLPTVDRVTNEGFHPMVLTEVGWERVSWPAQLRIKPITSSSKTWLFAHEETWYLEETAPE